MLSILMPILDACPPPAILQPRSMRLGFLTIHGQNQARLTANRLSGELPNKDFQWKTLMIEVCLTTSLAE